MVTNAPSVRRVSAKPLEEPGQDLGRFRGENPLAHLGSMVQTHILGDVVERPGRPGFGIGRSVDEGAKPGGSRRASNPGAGAPQASRAVETAPAPGAKGGAPGVAKTLKCGECGTLNRPTEWYCERCGAELAGI